MSTTVKANLFENTLVTSNNGSKEINIRFSDYNLQEFKDLSKPITMTIESFAFINNICNLTTANNKFKYTYNGTPYEFSISAPASVEYTQIQTAINQTLAKNNHLIGSKANIPIFELIAYDSKNVFILKFNDPNSSVVFDNETFQDLLGFTNASYSSPSATVENPTNIEAENPPDFMPTSSIRLHTDYLESPFGVFASGICSVFLDVRPGAWKEKEFMFPLKIHLKSTKFLDKINFFVTDQNNSRDFNIGNSFQFKVSFKIEPQL